MTAVEWVPGQPCRVVEHNDSTRQPREGGEVAEATVLRAEGLYVQAQVTTGPLAGRKAQFWAESGWTAWDGSFRWRLLPAEDTAATTEQEG